MSYACEQCWPMRSTQKQNRKITQLNLKLRKSAKQQKVKNVNHQFILWFQQLYMKSQTVQKGQSVSGLWRIFTYLSLSQVPINTSQCQKFSIFCQGCGVGQFLSYVLETEVQKIEVGGFCDNSAFLPTSEFNQTFQDESYFNSHSIHKCSKMSNKILDKNQQKQTLCPFGPSYPRPFPPLGPCGPSHPSFP